MTNDLTARQAIRIWLAKHDKSQRWLADKIRVSPPRLSDILSGRLTPTDDERKRLLKVTGIDMATFAKVA